MQAPTIFVPVICTFRASVTKILGEGTQGKMSFPQIVASYQAPPCSRSEIRVNLGISSISDFKKKLAKRLIAGIG